jgi:hypothetical protein
MITYRLILVILVSFSIPVHADQLPRLPSPQGFIEASSLSEKIRTQALIGHPPSDKLIGVYYEPSALANILSAGSSNEPTPFCRAYLQGKFESSKDADDFLKRLIGNAKKESEQKFNRNDNDALDRILKRYEKAIRDKGVGETPKFTGATDLGELAETDTYYASTMIVAFAVSDGQRNGSIAFVAAVAWMRIENQIIQISATYPFLDKASILGANDTLLKWIESIVSR